MTTQHHAIKQLEKRFQSWKDLKRLRTTQTLSQKKKEKIFVDSLDNFFDISHAYALDMIVNPEDKKLLLGQQEKGRYGCMGPVDKSLAAKKKRIALKRKGEDMRKKRSEKECEASTSKAVVLLSFISSSSENENSTEKSISDEAEEPCLKRSRAITNIVTPSLAAALDRTCVPNRRATAILSEAAINLGHDPHKLAINRTTIARSRQKAKTTFVQHLKKSFMQTNHLQFTGTESCCKI